MPYKLPRYPSNKLLFLEVCRKVIEVQQPIARKQKHGYSFPIQIGVYLCANTQNSKNAKIEMSKYRFDLYQDPQGRFDPIGNISKVMGEYFIHESKLEDHWANCEE